MKKNKYTFLIVTPSYNQGSYIKKTINSVLSQDVSVKYIVMDGNSNDNTVDILKTYSNKIHWKSEKDRGQTDAINKGILFFKEYVKKQPVSKKYIFAYINSDDYYLPYALKRVVLAFDKNPKSQWVVGDYEVLSQKNNTFHNLLIVTWKNILKRIFSLSTLLVLNPIAQPSTFIRWEAVEKIGLFNTTLSYVMDYEYWLRLQKKFGNPYFLKEKISTFRIHDVSKGGSQFEKQFNEQYKIAKTFTNNYCILLLHRIHNWIIITLYRLTK